VDDALPWRERSVVASLVVDREQGAGRGKPCSVDEAGPPPYINLHVPRSLLPLLLNWPKILAIGCEVISRCWLAFAPLQKCVCLPSSVVERVVIPMNYQIPLINTVLSNLNNQLSAASMALRFEKYA